jgi:hypothetical protein
MNSEMLWVVISISQIPPWQKIENQIIFSLTVSQQIADLNLSATVQNL